VKEPAPKSDRNKKKVALLKNEADKRNNDTITDSSMAVAVRATLTDIFLPREKI
jgi:hypothetical protein